MRNKKKTLNNKFLRILYTIFTETLNKITTHLYFSVTLKTH